MVRDQLPSVGPLKSSHGPHGPVQTDRRPLSVPPTQPVPPLTTTKKGASRRDGPDCGPCSRATVRGSSGRPSGPRQQRSLFRTLAGLGGRVDLGGLAGSHRAPSEVLHGCLMEIILWSM